MIPPEKTAKTPTRCQSRRKRYGGIATDGIQNPYMVWRLRATDVTLLRVCEEMFAAQKLMTREVLMLQSRTFHCHDLSTNVGACPPSRVMQASAPIHRLGRVLRSRRPPVSLGQQAIAHEPYRPLAGHRAFHPNGAQPPDVTASRIDAYGSANF